MDQKPRGVLDQKLKQVAQMVKENALPNSCIENGKIYMNRLEASQPPEGRILLRWISTKECPKSQ